MALSKASNVKKHPTSGIIVYILSSQSSLPAYSSFEFLIQLQAMSTINLVKIYTLLHLEAEEMRHLTALAYQISRDRNIYPRALLIR